MQRLTAVQVKACAPPPVTTRSSPTGIH